MLQMKRLKEQRNTLLLTNLLKIYQKYQTLIGENGVRLSGGKNKEYQLRELLSKKVR